MGEQKKEREKIGKGRGEIARHEYAHTHVYMYVACTPTRVLSTILAATDREFAGSSNAAIQSSRF